MLIQPLHANLLVDPFAPGEITKGGLLIPQIGTDKKPYRFAKVLAVGAGRVTSEGHLVPCSSRVGDVVAYARNQGVELPIDGDDGAEKVVLLIAEQFVLGIVVDMPVQSMLTGLDGRLLQMSPHSRATTDVQDEHIDLLALARKQGIIEKGPDGLDEYERADKADAEQS